MIAKLLAAVRNAQPGPMSALAGTALVGVGLYLVNRYQAHQLKVVDELQNEIADLEFQASAADSRAAKAARHADLVEAAPAGPPYQIVSEPAAAESAGDGDLG